ncbi:MAG: high-affinity branched-chain amino acid ABC transporter permease LivM [Desulfovibrionaceae bacterium]
MKQLTKAALVALWFMLLTFPLIGIKIDTVSKTFLWRWDRIALMGVGIFVAALLWQYCFQRKSRGLPIISLPESWNEGFSLFSTRPIVRRWVPLLVLLGLATMPMFTSMYQTNIMISALLYVMLALGLNIVVGLAGQLVLGYVAFYAVGAYTYGILYQHFGWGFWTCLPLGGLMSVLFGLALGFPVLRLRGDYLAIVTLGFGEIIRISLQNWSSVTGGPNGISSIARPSLFGMEMDIDASTIYIYYLVLLAVIITALLISRLKHSRVGLALQALREDEIASEAMGIDITKVKLSAFALSSCWAGFAGVIFAAKTTFINPASFSFMESAMILSMVVLGGMGSITGVIIAALILILVPEYLRAFSEYRMLLFGMVMVLMMIFRPQGLITGEKRQYRLPKSTKPQGDAQ